jgi:succinylglutamate desuccinylase
VNAAGVTLELPQRLIGQAHADEPGATLIIIGSMHGNEPAGRVAGRAVIEAIEAQGGLKRGRVVALLGNRRASATGNQRYLDEDLNRMFTPARVHQARLTDASLRSPEMAELVELVEAIEDECIRARGPMFLVDIHTVSSKSPPFAAVEDSLRGRAFARRFGLPLLLGFEEELEGLLSDYFTSAFNGVGLVVEAGEHRDANAAGIAEAVIWRALEGVGLIEAGERDSSILEASAGDFSNRVFDVRYRHVIGSEDFEIFERIHAFDPVSAGEAIGEESEKSVLVPEPGLVFMPNRQVSKRVGDDGYFVVRPVGWKWLTASAWIRRRRLIHLLLPKVLPGVRTRPGHPGELLVSPRVAAVMKRELFHLLGYRLIRHTGERHLGTGRRVLLGMAAFAGAVGTMIAGIFRGGERGVLREETPEDWIVARRHLDQLDEMRTEEKTR